MSAPGAPPGELAGTDLTVARVRAHLVALAGRGLAAERPLSLVSETGSTNDDARAAARAGAPHGAAFVAEAQRAGRGRAGNRWHSPPHENIYLSLLLRPGRAAAAVAPLTLALGVAAARAIEAVAPVRVALKWPNDLHVGGRKLAGILVEATTRGSEPPVLVAGIGVNVHGCAFPPELAPLATSLALAGAPGVDRSELVARLVLGFERAVVELRAAGLAAFAAELDARDALRGRAVAIGGVSCIADGIDPSGRLCVRTPSGAVIAVASGEARPVAGDGS
ncbi:MAG: biotin--[acetyl-CoA-carboxylase] ligase [Myxococcales bacterium]|nr:biotin--[acetyl-CoA-carboxylase] ligase [Myxococcales bacterium]